MTSGSLLALLAACHRRANSLAASLHEQTRALLRERWLRECAGTLGGAARSSSAAVLAALDQRLRELEPRIDAVLVFSPSGDEFACCYTSGSRCEHYRRMRIRRDNAGSAVARAAVSRCRATCTGDGALLAADRFGVAVPLCDPEIRAVVYASCSGSNAVKDVEAVVETIQAASVPYAAALERESDRIDATHDGLTGLLTPRAFRRQLHAELARGEASTADTILSVWFVDTDRFKEINDRYGHPAGDAVLQTMASLLQAHLVPGTDVAARNGGDEFCALIRNATKSAAIERAYRFLEAVRRHQFASSACVTASIGVATYPHDAATSNDLLEVADAAMYHSKRNGRDRVSFVALPGRFASVPEAEMGPSRSPERWLSTHAASSVESSS